MFSDLKKILGPDEAKQLNYYMVWLIGFSVLQGIAMVMLVPLLSALFLKDSAAFMMYLAILALLVALICFAHYQHTMKGFNLALTVLGRLHQRLGDHLITLPLGWFSAEKAGRLSKSATEGALMVTNILAHFMSPVVSGLVTPATIAFLMLFIDWRMGIVALCCGPLIYIAHRWSSKWIGLSEIEVDAAGVEVNNRVVEFAQKQSLLRVFGLAQEGYRPLDESIAAQQQAGRAMLDHTLPRLLAGGMIVQLTFILLVVVGVILFLNQALLAIELVVLLALLARLTSPLAEAAGRSGLLRMASNDLNRLARIFNEAPLNVPKVTAAITQPGDVRFDNVQFGYDSRHPILSNLSLHAPQNTMTAIIGSSGSGKTTISRLMMRFFDVQQGAVYVGGVDVRQQTTEALMAQISLVMQDVYLFDDTLEANIRIGCPDASAEALAEAAHLAGIDEMIQRLPNGWLTRVGEGGAALSGGERQRVSIARAIIKNAPIMLLDEATSSLDPENEYYIRQAMAVIKQRSTLIVIAHHMPTIMSADQILFLENGHIEAQGSHDVLINQSERYQQFWQGRMQAKGWCLRNDRDI